MTLPDHLDNIEVTFLHLLQFAVRHGVQVHHKRKFSLKTVVSF